MSSSIDYKWYPSQSLIDNSNLTRFFDFVGIYDYQELTKKADEDSGWFYDQVIKFTDIRFYKPYEKIVDLSRGIPWARWCVGGTTNLTMNCIDRHRGTETYLKPFIVWEKEDGTNGTLTYQDFDQKICQLANALTELGYGQGDVIGIYLPNIWETFATFFAIAKIGAIVAPLFSGYGPQPLITRINDGGLKAIITADGTPRRGSPTAMKPMLDEIKEQVPTLEKVIVINNMGDQLETPMTADRDYWWHDIVESQATEAETVEMDADAPCVLLYTSGTTGKPKGAVWTHCSFITRMASDMLICGDFKPEDRFFFMSDMGWMVGPMCAVTPSFGGGSLLVTEGAPDYPTSDRFWRLVDQYEVSYLGVSPTLIRSLMRNGDEEVAKYKFEKLRITWSGGEAWTETPWLWFFEHVCRSTCPIVNMSGGTEIGGSIAIGTVHHPSLPGSFAGPAPGMGADIVDDSGNSLGADEVGELVLRNASIGLTRSLWKNDERYMDAYWNTIPNLWVHGDWVKKDTDGNWYILGRSDDTIKVSGKRTGPSELEGILMETGMVTETAVIGIPDPIKGSAICCVCVAKPGVAADTALTQLLSAAIVEGMGKSYRPKAIYYVNDLPRTRTMKIMRRVVRAIFLDKDPGDLSSLVNPETVDELKAKIDQS